MIDAFCFRNEWECLEVRLHELAPYVDRFVLVEGDTTFQGNPKPLSYLDRHEEFSDFEITYVAVEDFPDGSPWDREAWQRNAIMRALAQEPDEEVVLISDADEIPRGEKLEEAIELLEDEQQVAFEQTLSFYHVDAVDPSVWKGTQATTVGHLRLTGPEQIRAIRNTPESVADAGVHWCNLGDVDWLIEKFESFSHVECNTPEFKDPELLAECIAEHREMTGRPELSFTVRDDTWLPAYLLENRERFAHLFAGVKV